jgi:hypothetical protein
MSAALTPRVRTLVVCDSIRASKTEEDVFHLRGLRSHVVVDAFPVWRRLRLFLILSSPRAGRFPCYVKIVDEVTDLAVCYGKFKPAPMFSDVAELLPLDLPLAVRFPKPGRYLLQVWFFQEAAADILKMEQPFHVLLNEA